MSLQTFNRLLEEIQALIERPTSNLTAASLLLAIVVIGVLVVLIVALLALTSTRRPRRVRTPRAGSADSGMGPASAGAARPRVLSRQQLTWASVAIALVALGGMYISTSGEVYCSATCHTMTPSADSWKASAHATVACTSCHESSVIDGTFSRIRHAVAEAGPADITSFEASVAASRCIRCHPEAAENTAIEGRGLRVIHGHFTAEGVDCARCHAQVGHLPAAGVRSGSMSECLRCHDGEVASATCATCHIDDVGFTTVEDRSFGRVRLPQPTCGGCHQEATCDACHGLRMPHPEDYADPRQHAYAGAFTGRETLCYRCHTPRDCTECHGTLVLEGGGHSVSWRTAHRQYSYADGNGYCLACHKTEDFCRVCHQQ